MKVVEITSLGTLELRLRKWRDGLGTPKDPPIAAATAEQLAHIQARRREELGTGRPAHAARKREALVQQSRQENARRADQRLRDRLDAIRERDQRRKDNLAALAKLTGTEAESFPQEHEQQYRSAAERRYKQAREEALDASGYRTYLAEIADHIALRGFDSLSREQKAVLRNRLATLRTSGLQAELDAFVRDL